MNSPVNYHKYLGDNCLPTLLSTPPPPLHYTALHYARPPRRGTVQSAMNTLDIVAYTLPQAGGVPVGGGGAGKLRYYPNIYVYDAFLCALRVRQKLSACMSHAVHTPPPYADGAEAHSSGELKLLRQQAVLLGADKPAVIASNAIIPRCRRNRRSSRVGPY